MKPLRVDIKLQTFTSPPGSLNMPHAFLYQRKRLAIQDRSGWSAGFTRWVTGWQWLATFERPRWCPLTERPTC